MYLSPISANTEQFTGNTEQLIYNKHGSKMHGTANTESIAIAM